MKILIIFLCLIGIFIYITVFLKIKVEYDLEVKNTLWHIKRKFLKKEINKEFEISIDTVIDAIFKKYSSKKNLDDTKFAKDFNITLKETKEFLELIEIEKVNISAKIGTPFISATNALIVSLSTIIPVIYEKTDNRNGKLLYSLIPNYNDFELTGNIYIIFNITILKFLWLKKFLSKRSAKNNS